MKKYIYIIILFLTIIIASCNKFLDVVPDNIATIDNAFTDKYNAEKYLFTCYSYLPSFSEIYADPALASGDEIWFNKPHQLDPQARISRGEQNIISPIFDYWGSGALYVGIRDCNTFLEKIGRVRDVTDYQRVQWVAEVNFLKAYYHYYLIRMYGPMHITNVSIPITVSTQAIKVMRDPLDSCFNYVVNLLDSAIKYLPADVSNPLTGLGRITKPIAMAVKAEVLITAASPLFNGNPNYADIKNPDGTFLFSSAFDASKWVKAADACKAAIDMCQTVGISLFQKKDYISLNPIGDTTRYIAALRNSVTQLWNKELIWGYSRSTSVYLQYSACPRLYACTENPVGSFMSPTLKIAEQFYSYRGVPINEDPTWDYANRYKIKKGTQKDRFFIEENEETANLNFGREYRYYSSLSFDRDTWFGNGKGKDEKDVYHIHNRRGEFSSIIDQQQYGITGYFPKKLVNMGSEIRDGKSFVAESYAFPIIRLADLYLYYAEALNETKLTPDVSVTEYIDIVRNRAGLEGVVASWTKYSSKPDKPTTKSGMREIIQGERLIELAFEGKRFWDLRRWLLAEKYLNQPVKGWNVDGNTADEYYKVTTLFPQTFSTREYLWPISENEIVKNPNLVQNPGW